MLFNATLFPGWFAKEPGVLHKVGYLLLQLSYTNSYQPKHFIIADDCFEMVKIQSNRLTQVVVRSVERLFGSMSSLPIGYYFNFTKKKEQLKAVDVKTCW
jgi:tetraacyldisaccharide-1-P 4'-kinase